MILLMLILLFVGLFGVYDALRTVNNNILKQTREIKKINEHLKQINENSRSKLNSEEE